jgi:amidase
VSELPPALWTAVEQAAALARRQLSSRELLDSYLERIGRLNPAVNAVVTLDEERARREAGRADDETARGHSRGPLHGLPVTIKDAIEVAGMRSTGGAIALSTHVPEHDAPAVDRLRRAGAIVFGKTNVPEWSGDLQTYNEIFGVTNNPWDQARTPGGSSGGAATAVACGFTSFELGTDIGGSVRTPSHCCGVFGLKPTFGIVPQRGYLGSLGGQDVDSDINVFGPLARSAEDLDVLLQVLANAADGSPGVRFELPRSIGTSAAGLRVGVWLEAPGQPVQAAQLAVLRRAAEQLENSGARVEDSHPPVDFGEQVELFRRLILAAVTPSMDRATAEALSPSHLAWQDDDRHRARLRRTWERWFSDYDLLLCPVLPVAPFPHDNGGDLFSRSLDVDGRTIPYIEAISWAGLIGVVGLPSAVAPVGPDSTGLPAGIQVVAGWYRDRDAIAGAGLLAELAGGYRVPPGFET